MDADAEQDGLRNSQDPFADGEDVGLLEVGEGRIEDQRDGLGQLVLEIDADLFIRAFGRVDDILQEARIVGVKIDREMLGGIGLPGESLVVDLVFAVIGIVGHPLAEGDAGQGGQQDERGESVAGPSHGGSFT